MEPEPETMKSIEAAGRALVLGCVWNCGCDKRKARWYLCAYHEGFEAGLECARTVPLPESVDSPT